MRIFHRIVHAGASQGETSSARQGILLTNYVSLGLGAAVIVLMVARILFGQWNSSVDIGLVIALFTLLSPLLLNHLGLTNMSRLTLCWLPPLFSIIIVILALKTGFRPEISAYTGIRLYLLAFTCIPFIVFDLQKPWIFLAGLLGPLLVLFFFDFILNATGVGFWQLGLNESGYAYNNVRSPIAFLVIAFSCYSLKRIVEKGQRLNDQLLKELTEKNEVIRQQAATDLQRLNLELRDKVKALSEREFILNQSQQIARIGSWEYRVEDTRHLWSDEMYNILELNKDMALSTETLTQILPEEHISRIISVTNELLRTGDPFDVTIKASLPDRDAKWLRVCAFPVYKESDIVGVMGICHDVTFYKRVEERIAASEKKYHSLFEQASDAIMITDFQGNFLDVNTSLCTMFGYAKDELLSMNISALIDPDQLRNTPLAMEPLARGNHVFSERRMVHRNGTVVDVEANVKRFDETSVMAIARDVTLRKVHERELSEANRKVEELRLTALRSVMSPHFVFNVLNSVQFFIAKNDRENAINYLATFSKLVRNVLMQSMNSKIKLCDEIEMLRNYVDLEMTRFQDKFSFSLDVDPGVDVEATEIPSLLVQPFVENAIIHGLYNKLQPGKLSMQIKEQEDLLVFVIEDNGIGRKAAMELMQKNLPQHDSVGSRVTEERLRLIGQHHEVIFRIEDLMDEGAACGTRVTIGIKV